MEKITYKAKKLSHYVPSGHRWKLEVYLYPFSIPELESGGMSKPCPSRFTSGKENSYPFYRMLCGPWGRPGWIWKISHYCGPNSNTFSL
jgi:hypothetical protein